MIARQIVRNLTGSQQFEDLITIIAAARDTALVERNYSDHVGLSRLYNDLNEEQYKYEQELGEQA